MVRVVLKRVALQAGRRDSFGDIQGVAANEIAKDLSDRIKRKVRGIKCTTCPDKNSTITITANKQKAGNPKMGDSFCCEDFKGEVRDKLKTM